MNRAKSFAKAVLSARTVTAISRAKQRISGRDQRLEEARRRAAGKDRELARLRAELEQARGAAFLTGAVRTLPVFFVVGYAKSGTSWLTRILNTHPEILCRGEGIFFGRGADLGIRRGLLTPTSLHGALADSENLRAWVERNIWTRGDDADRHLDNLTSLAVRYVLGSKLSASGKKIVGDKTPFVTEDCLQEIKLLVPEAKVIHIIRDGRDVAVSAMHHLWNHTADAGGHMTIKPEELAKRDAYRKDPEAFVANGESIFDEERLRKGFAEGWNNMTLKAATDGSTLLGEQYAEVQYEELLEHPVESVARLLEFLGADASDEETVRRCVEETSFERITKRKKGEEDSSSFYRKGIAGDWKNVFTEEDRRVFKEVAGEALIRLGYERDNNW